VHRGGHPSAKGASAADNSGEAVWGVVDGECNEAGVENNTQIVDHHVVSLRATRSGQGEGRVYTIWLQAIDAGENLSEPLALTVCVLHDRRNTGR